MQEWILLFIMKFFWAVSIVLCSVCKNSKIKGFGSKNFKNERWKNTKKSDFGTWTFETPLLSSNVPNWLLIRIWDFTSTSSPLLDRCPQVYFFLKASLILFYHIWVLIFWPFASKAKSANSCLIENVWPSSYWRSAPEFPEFCHYCLYMHLRPILISVSTLESVYH